MLHVVLHNPEIPPNTGNVIRLCANTGTSLHLIRPLGFELDHAKLRRAGLDYHEFATVAVHDDLDACFAALNNPRTFAFTTRGNIRHTDVRYADNDTLLFGCETRGLPDEVKRLKKLGAAGVITKPFDPMTLAEEMSAAIGRT